MVLVTCVKNLYRSHQGFDFANYLIFVVVAAFVINLDIFDNSLLTTGFVHILENLENTGI